MLSVGVVLKLVPVIVTSVPIGPDAGVKLVIVGVDDELVTVKLEELVPVNSPTVTEMVPVLAPVGTVATIDVDVGVPVMFAVVPLNFTVLFAAVVLKFIPVIMTDVPTAPDVGVKVVTVGCEE
jgi:hypothetical protein